MKDQIEELRHSIESILLNEQITDEWVRGRHSAFRGVKIKLDEILNLSQSKEALTLGNQEQTKKNFTCPGCGHKFEDKSELQSHMMHSNCLDM